MKIATWNVNGVRARQAQLREWMERDRPDVVCLQELKAEVSQIPEQVKLEDYHAYWHGFRAYSGVSLHIRKGLFDTDPAFSHPNSTWSRGSSRPKSAASSSPRCTCP